MHVSEAIKIIKEAANNHASMLEDNQHDNPDYTVEIEKINEAFRIYDNFSILRDRRDV